MGRMLEALKRADSTPSETNAQHAVSPLVALCAESPSARVEGEEIPFIEVGPRKSMEASPSVLACAPLVGGGINSPSTLQPPTATPATPSTSPALGVPTAQSVRFRAVPGRMELRSRFAAELAAYHAPEQPAARQYRQVLDAVLNTSAASERPAALLFTAALPRTGNTTTLLNLAITAARQGRQRVLVVDANLRQPSVADRLGLAAAPGLREVLAGMVALDEVIQPTEQANLFTLTAGIHDSAGMRFVAETMRSLLRQLRQSFPLVFVDGPRWDGQQDGTVLAAACDAVYLVVPEQQAETAQIDALLQHIPHHAARLAGCILVADSSRCA